MTEKKYIFFNCFMQHIKVQGYKMRKVQICILKIISFKKGPGYIVLHKIVVT